MLFSTQHKIVYSPINFHQGYSVYAKSTHLKTGICLHAPAMQSMLLPIIFLSVVENMQACDVLQRHRTSIYSSMKFPNYRTLSIEAVVLTHVFVHALALPWLVLQIWNELLCYNTKCWCMFNLPNKVYLPQGICSYSAKYHKGCAQLKKQNALIYWIRLYLHALIRWSTLLCILETFFFFWICGNNYVNQFSPTTLSKHEIIKLFLVTE